MTEQNRKPAPSRLTDLINQARAEKRPALIPFLPAAYPGPETFWAALMELADHGADIVEIGVPFSDPVADGPVVAAASQEALANGGGLKYIFEGLREKRRRLKCGLALMGYVNPFIQYAWFRALAENPRGTAQELMAASLGHLAREAAEAGIEGLIVPDLPLEESEAWREALKACGLALIPLVGPNTDLKRMSQYARTASGYVYVVSVLGTTGAREGLPPEAREALVRARKVFDLPLALGFGLKSPRQLDGLAPSEAPDGVVFGSALINHLKNGAPAREFMKLWRP